MTDEEIDDKLKEKLSSLSARELYDFLADQSQNESLTNKEKKTLLEIKAELKQDFKKRDKEANRILKEEGPQMLKLISESLKDGNYLTTEERQQLEITSAKIAGYLTSFWLPSSLISKVFMVLLLAVGVIGVLLYKPWFWMFIILGCLFSPKIIGSVAAYIGAFYRDPKA